MMATAFSNLASETDMAGDGQGGWRSMGRFKYYVRVSSLRRSLLRQTPPIRLHRAQLGGRKCWGRCRPICTIR